MRDSEIFKGGNIVALITPFEYETNRIDINRLEKLIEFHINKHTDGILILGTTGESPTLLDNEMKEMIYHSVRISNKRIPIIVGCGGNNTKNVIDRAIFCKSNDVDGLLITVPNYNKPTQQGILQHFSNIANSVDLPIMMYNIPSRCGVNMETETIIKIYNTCQNICAIKEANGNLDSIINLINKCNIRVYIGDDAALLPALSIGCVGVVSVISNIFPDRINDIIRLWHIGESNSLVVCRQKFFKIYNLIKALFIETNPTPTKELMKHIHMLDNPHVRLPLVNMSNSNLTILIQEYTDYINN